MVHGVDDESGSGCNQEHSKGFFISHQTINKKYKQQSTTQVN